nr:hypothetical protein [Allomuricauda sp.]
MGKKNLEQLFRDTFKDFQDTPDEQVWKSIEATLDEKKQKKRVIPLWWRLGGVAALLAILFYAINPFGGSGEGNETNTPIITDTENLEKPSLNVDSVDTDTKIANQTEEERQKDSIHESDTSIDFNESKGALAETEKGMDESRPSNADRKTEDAQGVANVDEEVGQELPNNKNQKSNLVDKAILQKEVVAENENENKNTPNNPNVDAGKLLDNKQPNVSEEVAAANQEDEQKAAEKETPNLINEKAAETLLEKEAVAENDPEKNEDIEDSGKKSIFDAIAEQNAEEDEDLVAENGESKWSMGPSVAPVYFNGSGEGSPIHSNFSSNSKSGNVNLSYGLTVAYNLGKRLKVRSGVHRVDFGYDTNEIVFSSSIESSTNALIDNIDYSQTSRNLVVQSKRETPNVATGDAFVELNNTETPGLDGKMVQQLGYIEVPLELNYALIDKKFGVNIIGGMSSLFLVDNTVLLESEELVTEMGEANNANSVNFSTNVGIGLNYEFSPKMQLNLEPMFKYQLNTFSETAGPFRPFSVGVYSGVSFKF